MATINYAAREIHCKIIYYGPGLGGKSTNLEYLYDRLGPESRGQLVSLASESERTLFFDCLSIELGRVQGFRTRIHLYSVPGQVYYNASRKLVLGGADGVVFVADSQGERLGANLEAMHNLQENLAGYGRDWRQVPLVVQYNKRDLPGIEPVSDLERALNPRGVPSFEAVGTRGLGVFDTVRAISRQVIQQLS